LCSACIFVCTALLAQNPCDGLPVINIAVNDPTPCQGDEVLLSASGAVTYNWNKNVENGVGFVPSVSDTFTVISTDANGCMDTSDVFIEVLDVPDIVANSSSLNTCLGDSVFLSASNGVSYNWLEPVIPNGSFYVPTAIGANIFTVEGEGANGCTNTSQVIVVIKDLPATPTLNLDSVATCVDVAYDDQIVASASEGRTFWFTNPELTDEYGDEETLTVANGTVGKQVYYASAFLGGCYSNSVRAVAEVLPRPSVDAGSDLSLEPAERSNLSGIVDSDVDVEWSPSDRLSDMTDPNTAFTATNSTTYTLTATDENGCVNTDQMEVTVEANLTISNIITPNGDGDNDVWKMYPKALLQTCNVRVFDGFGRLLLETDNYANDWDATFEQKALPDGDYYYHIQCNDIDEKGTLVIIN